MLANQENFVDITLIRCFHKAYLNKHFDWMQACTDLTGCTGFQAHNIAVRHHLMDRDVKSVVACDHMKPHHHAVAQWHVDDVEERKRHLKKLEVFIVQATDALHKHFRRWLNVALLPAGLLAEAPMAKVISAVIMKEDCPTTFDGVDANALTQVHQFKSEVHGEVITLERFYKWLKQVVVDTDDECCEEGRQAAQLILQDIDMRAFDYVGDVGTLRLYMHATCLPLASQTQFVERFVKEAKHVSATDRSEEHRTWMAIVRAWTPLGRSTKEEDMSFNASKITATIESATERSSQHALMQTNQEDHEHDVRIAQLSHSLASAGHFKNERIEAKIAKVDEKGAQCKKQNVAQAVREQDKTATVTGLVPYGKLVIKRNLEDLLVELRFRGAEEEEIPPNIKGRIELLKKHETKRLMEAENMSQRDAVKHRAFRKQSGAPFNLIDT